MIYIVDPLNWGIFVRSLASLEEKTEIDARRYPFDKHIESFGGYFHYWHQSQFNLVDPISPDDLAELRKLYDIEEGGDSESDKIFSMNVFSSTDCLATEIAEATEPKQDTQSTGKRLVEMLAAYVNIGKADLTQSILDLRQKKFDREQAQMKELLL